MRPITRRGFVETLSATAALVGVPHVAPVMAGAPEPSSRPVHLSGDGLGITPREYAALLDQACRSRAVAEDNYLLGGEVERFEHHWAQVLGKERAVFMPSGTLANHLALRALAGAKRRKVSW
jgi:threonine aldolase